MPNPPFATPDDVAARWRPLSDDELDKVATLCDDASTLIRAQYPGIDAQVASGGLDSNVLTIVCAGMVKRALIGPADGVAAQTQSEGPFAVAQTFANPLGNVFLTAADVTLILGYQPTSMSVRFTNTTTHNEECGFGYLYSRG